MHADSLATSQPSDQWSNFCGRHDAWNMWFQWSIQGNSGENWDLTGSTIAMSPNIIWNKNSDLDHLIYNFDDFERCWWRGKYWNQLLKSFILSLVDMNHLQVSNEFVTCFKDAGFDGIHGGSMVKGVSIEDYNT